MTLIAEVAEGRIEGLVEEVIGREVVVIGEEVTAEKEVEDTRSEGGIVGIVGIVLAEA